MAQEVINIGAIADDGTGDTVRGAGIKINNNFTEIYAEEIELSHLEFSGNVILGTQSNADLEFSASGTGVIDIQELTIDSTINFSDNEIRTNTSNADMTLTANGTGSIVINNIDLDSGTIDDTIIGGTTAAAGTFTVLNVDMSASIDGVTIADNTITTTTNADLEISGSGTGAVSFDGVKFPTADGTTNQVLRTDGSGQLTYFTAPIIFDQALIDDGTDTITGNSVAQTFDTFSASSYRSANYLIQVSDGTNDRYGLVEANVTHDGSNAYISVFGGVGNGTGDGSTVYDSLEFTAIINSGEVRVRAKVNNTTTQTLKFVRRIVKV